MTEREQLLSDILTTAVEGGINYWANDRAEDGSLQVYDVQRAEDLSVLAVRFVVEAVEDVSGAKVRAELKREKFEATYQANDVEDGVAVVDFRAVRWALKHIAAGNVKLRKDIIGTCVRLNYGDLDADYDAGDADVILQVALFGEVIYG